VNPAYLATGGWIAAAVGAVASLGIAELVDATPRTARELADSTGTSEAMLGKVMRVLTHVGLFEEDADGRFSNTPDSAQLKANHPLSMKYFCQLAAGDYQRIMQALPHALRTGEPASAFVLGSPLYAYLDAADEAGELYDRAMEDLSRPYGVAVAETRDFSNARLVVDVGGGRGTIVKEIVRRHSHLRGVCADRETVCLRAETQLRRDDPELAARMTFIPTDFFAAVPGGGDVYILKNVVHNWNDDSCLRILRNIAAAMAPTPGARLSLMEPVAMPPLYEASDGLVKAVLGEKGMPQRSEAEFSALIEAAGLHIVDAYIPETGMAIIDARLPQTTGRTKVDGGHGS
jgi:O-methyltransferase domain